ncbi:ShlB/FhaC/HecB family hemolysin secretion/activation protein [Sphingomonas sp. CLY1604]|uniref:ShlB/FhaC/HecB family hemolysin secretion/activation protein n=1 Tax=Sphingomonas sp. CLY1604 TaxID=3457786 RepID=UPI003FD848D7
MSLAALGLAQAGVAGAQVRLDRADPTITEKSLPAPGPDVTQPPATTEVATPAGIADTAQRTPTITAITVADGGLLPAAAYAQVLANATGRALDRADLAKLAGDVAAVAQARGFPFATASVEPQPMRDGILRVTLDPGRIDAVRVVGARNAAADALLVKVLVTHGPVRQATLERALSLLADMPGVTVKQTRYVRQQGFGILLVTIDQDRASAYLQIDNRGSKEVGPIRSTLLGNIRNVASDGDELGIIVAQTPIQPSEFAFLRLRYAAPVDAAGSILAVSGSIGRSHPGASLAALDVIGNSGDLAVTYARPLLRRRSEALWATAEWRAVSIDQSLAGQRLRADRLSTFTGSVNGFTPLAGGVFRGEVSAVAGLPLAGVSHEGDRFISRPDGDARFVAATYTFDWTTHLSRPISIVLASAGQLASRPLLATAEIGIGGPVFARAYDYAERTGDQGIMGSAELRADTGRLIAGVIDRTQVYGFVDGGVVRNLRDGFGGGSLASSGVGLRAGTGRIDGMVEVALPLNSDRFDTGDRTPRISLRLSRIF